jgi:hypothetical protein
MSIHKKPGRFRAVITAVALAAGALAAGSASAQPAAASGACTPSFSNAIPDWAESAAPAGGVTLCAGTNGAGQTDAYVQIVDLSAGAKVRLIADPCASTDPCAGKYKVRTAADWDSWIRSNVTRPDGSRLFSTSNAAFFTDTSGNPTLLSLPFVQTSNTIGQNGHPSVVSDPGFALTSSTAPNPDPAWKDPKRAITFGDQSTTPQEVHMFDFPLTCRNPNDDPPCTAYTQGDLGTPLAPLCNSTCPEWDATVGLTPDFDANTGSARLRVYVGVSAPSGSFNFTKVYILDTAVPYTVTEAKGILESFGSQQEIQLDGGGSTQLYANGSHLIDSNVPLFGRAVPMALAVYKAPPSGYQPDGSAYQRLQFVANHYQGVSTRIDVTNAGTASAHVSLQFYNDDGGVLGATSPVTIAPHATWTLPAGAAGPPMPPGTAGTAGIFSDSNKLRVSAREVPDAGGDSSTFYSPDTAGWQTIYAPVISKGALGGKNTVLRLYNMSGLTTTVTIGYRDQSGTLVAQTQSTLPAHARRDFDTTAVDALPAGFLGSATVQGSTTGAFLSGIVDEVGPGSARSTYNFASNGGPGDSCDLNVPAVFNQPGGLTSSITMQNHQTSNKSVTVNYLDAAGNVVATHPLTIPALGSVRVDQSAPGEVPPSSTGYSADISGCTSFVSVVELAGPGGTADAYTPDYLAGAGGKSIFWPMVDNLGNEGLTTTFAVQNDYSSGDGCGGTLILYGASDGTKLASKHIGGCYGAWKFATSIFVAASTMVGSGTNASAELAGDWPGSQAAVAIQQGNGQLLASLPDTFGAP